MEEKNIIAIEIGSSKVRGAIGVYGADGVLTVSAVEEESMKDWVRNGTVSNIEEVATLVNRVIRKIENRVSPRKVESVYVGIGGRSFMSQMRDVEIGFPEEMEITDEVIAQLWEKAKHFPYSDRELYGILPCKFMVDKKEVTHPKGTVGNGIRMSANLIVSRPQPKRNIERLFDEKLKISIAGFQVRHLAIADAVLTNEEKRLGCVLADFGAETTTVSIYKDGYLQYFVTLPIGARNITRDIMKMHMIEERAEDLKCTVGNASPDVATPTIGATDYVDLNNYVSHRAGEIIANVREQLKYSGYKASELMAGIIVVGNGARLAGFNERLSSKLGMRLRTGSVNLSEVRISNSKVSATDMVDVISVLCSVAKNNPVECLTASALEEYAEPVEVEVEPQYETEIMQEQEQEQEPVIQPKKAPKKKKSSIFGLSIDAIKNITEKIMSDSDDDDDESVYRDDD